VDILWDIVPLLLLVLTWLGFMLYSLFVERAFLLDIMMHTTLAVFLAFAVYVIGR
jgi:hypothetical protein